METQGLENVVYVSWEESERGWGTRPDGFSLHLTRNDFKEFERDYWGRMPNEVPDEYSRPAGDPTDVKVDMGLYKQIAKSKNGIRCYDEAPLVKGGRLVFVSKRTGWVPVGG